VPLVSHMSEVTLVFEMFAVCLVSEVSVVLLVYVVPLLFACKWCLWWLQGYVEFTTYTILSAVSGQTP
jgi:hypothetical protein